MSEKREQHGFCIQIGYFGREVNAVLDGLAALGMSQTHNLCWTNKAEPGWIPVGSVEFCAPAFGDHRVDFYPAFLWSWVRREMNLMEGPFWLGRERFVKSAESWKAEQESQVLPVKSFIGSGKWWVSEPVRFVQEWRYYVANGRVVTTGWYAGEDEDEPAPELPVVWDEDFSGAVDFGRLPDGTMELVEAHAPFACGWYGEHHKDYAKWLWESWQDKSWWQPS